MSVRLLASHFIISLFFSLTLAFLLLFLSFLFIDNNYMVKAQQQQLQQLTRTGAPLAIVPGLTGNILTAVSFLLGTSSFILGLRIQSSSKTATAVDEVQMRRSTPSTSTITKYYELLIIALVIPSIVINIYGILVISSHLYLEDAPYLLLLFVLFIPIGAILFLVKKLH
jgi:hypothetical protein